MFVLHPHSIRPDSPFRVEGELQRQGARVRWNLRVQAPANHVWRTGAQFGNDPRKNWELWNFDVVESFLQLRAHPDDTSAPYLELQVSPLGQPLCLIIQRPRVSFYTPLGLSFRPEVRLAPGLWETQVDVELPASFPAGELYGGLFACLGENPRSFHALNPNPEERPDFHRPELFRRL